MTSTARVRAAIDRTKQVLLVYWTSCLLQRSAGSPSAPSQSAAGSVYEMTVEEIEVALRGAEWAPYEHEGVSPGCVAFTAPIMGLVGLTRLDLLPIEMPVTLIDSKLTGFVDASVKGTRGTTWGTVIILGDHEGSEVVFTFHPGDPILPSRIPAEGNVGRVITAGEAVKLGLTWGKVVS